MGTLRNGRGLLGAAIWAACLLVLVLLPSGAQAVNFGPYEFNRAVDGRGSSSPCHLPPAEASWGYACLIPNGDIWMLVDDNADGLAVGIEWKNPADGRRGICLDKLGSAAGSTHCNKNYSEDSAILVRIGRCNANAHTCNSIGQYTNWTGYVQTYA